MTKILVYKKTLEEKLAEMKNMDIDLLELSIVSAQTDEGNVFPSFLHIGGTNTSQSHYKDFESIDEVACEVRLVQKTA